MGHFRDPVRRSGSEPIGFLKGRETLNGDLERVEEERASSETGSITYL